MSYTRTTRHIYVCLCERCFHKWEAHKLPKRCAKCTTPAWNGQDRRRGTFRRTRVQKASSK